MRCLSVFVCVALTLTLVAAGGKLTRSTYESKEECIKANRPQKMCETILGRWKAGFANEPTVDKKVRRACGDFDNTNDIKLCLRVIESGTFDENGKNTDCSKVESLKDLCLIKKDADDPKKGSKQQSIVPKLLQIHETLRSASRTKAGGCDPAQNRNRGMDDMGKPKEIVISNGRLNRERPYSEPPNRIVVTGKNAGCILKPEAAYAFCNGGGANAKETACAKPNGAVHDGQCNAGNIQNDLGNFFGNNGYLDTYFGAGLVLDVHQLNGDPSSFLWAIDSCGNIKMGDEFQDRQSGAVIANNRGQRVIKHGDLIPTFTGDARGRGRVGGEFRKVAIGAGRKWIANTCSSYTMLKKSDSIFGGQYELDHAHMCAAWRYMAGKGFDTNNSALADCDSWYWMLEHNQWDQCIDCNNIGNPVQC